MAHMAFTPTPTRRRTGGAHGLEKALDALLVRRVNLQFTLGDPLAMDVRLRRVLVRVSVSGERSEEWLGEGGGAGEG